MGNTRRRRRRRRRRGAGQRAAVIVCSIAVLAGAGFLLLREKPGENVSLASNGAISQEAESLAESGDKYQLRLAGIEKLNQGDYAEAIVDFEAAILASKGRVGEFETDVLKYRAEAEYMLKDYAAAAHTYQILTQLDGESAEYSYREALSLALAGDAQGSLGAYEKGVSLEEKEKDLSIGRSEVLAEVGKALTDAGLSQDADAIYREEIAKAGLDKGLGQYFAGLTNMRSVGVMGDFRTYDYAVALRAVNTSDFMTAECAEIPYEVLFKVTSRIINEVKGVNRVFYDLTSKPPGTIEFE